MQATPRRDTGPELALRRRLHALGLRYYVDRQPLPTCRRRADIVFPRLKLAVFVNGCYWHSCSKHGSWPKANAEWWRAKLLANRERDRETDLLLRRTKWTVIRIWEHEDLDTATKRVLRGLQRAGLGGPPSPRSSP